MNSWNWHEFLLIIQQAKNRRPFSSEDFAITRRQLAAYFLP
jgi:hypothetical protein